MHRMSWIPHPKHCRLHSVWHAARVINFDANATAPLCSAAREAWLEAVDRFPGNPSSQHRLGTRAEAALEQARMEWAEMLGCDPGLLIWTSGATESANLLFYHLAQNAPANAELWLSPLEHPCVIAAGSRSFSSRVKFVRASPQGRIELDSFRRMIETTAPKPSALACMAANNETGVLQPWTELAEICREHKVYFVCDATQWIGRHPAAGLGSCDFVLGSAHKMGGPKGAGFLKIASTSPWMPLVVGGPQESGRRAGTENVAALLAMTATLRERELRFQRGDQLSLVQAREAFEHALPKAVPGTRIVGSDSPRLWNTAMALMPPLPDCQQRWVVRLDRLGFAVSTGSACASGKEKPSHVLEAMGLSADTAAQALRFSVTWESDPHHWSQLLRALDTLWTTAIQEVHSPQP